jgi:hypothetical protein
MKTWKEIIRIRNLRRKDGKRGKHGKNFGR